MHPGQGMAYDVGKKNYHSRFLNSDATHARESTTIAGCRGDPAAVVSGAAIFPFSCASQSARFFEVLCAAGITSVSEGELETAGIVDTAVPE